MRTSSPSLKPTASNANCSAAVPELTARACLQPTYRANSVSNAKATGPVVSQPDRSTPSTASISSSPTEGTWKGIYEFSAILGEISPIELNQGEFRQCDQT